MIWLRIPRLGTILTQLGQYQVEVNSSTLFQVPSLSLLSGRFVLLKPLFFCQSEGKMLQINSWLVGVLSNSSGLERQHNGLQKFQFVIKINLWYSSSLLLCNIADCYSQYQIVVLHLPTRWISTPNFAVPPWGTARCMPSCSYQRILSHLLDIAGQIWRMRPFYLRTLTSAGRVIANRQALVHFLPEQSPWLLFADLCDPCLAAPLLHCFLCLLPGETLPVSFSALHYHNSYIAPLSWWLDPRCIGQQRT